MRIFALSISIFLLSSITACKTQKPEGEALSQKVKLPPTSISYSSLADYLNMVGGVTVTGVGDDIRLQIRGRDSIMDDTRPFIYIDEIPFGRGYSKANNALNPNNIEKVKILSSITETAVYGEAGHAGVIKIYTKTSN